MKEKMIRKQKQKQRANIFKFQGLMEYFCQNIFETQKTPKNFQIENKNRFTYKMDQISE